MPDLASSAAAMFAVINFLWANMPSGWLSLAGPAYEAIDKILRHGETAKDVSSSTEILERLLERAYPPSLRNLLLIGVRPEALAAAQVDEDLICEACNKVSDDLEELLKPAELRDRCMQCRHQALSNSVRGSETSMSQYGAGGIVQRGYEAARISEASGVGRAPAAGSTYINIQPGAFRDHAQLIVNTFDPIEGMKKNLMPRLQ